MIALFLLGLFVLIVLASLALDKAMQADSRGIFRLTLAALGLAGMIVAIFWRVA